MYSDGLTKHLREIKSSITSKFLILEVSFLINMPLTSVTHQTEEKVLPLLTDQTFLTLPLHNLHLLNLIKIFPEIKCTQS